MGIVTHDDCILDYDDDEKGWEVIRRNRRQKVRKGEMMKGRQK